MADHREIAFESAVEHSLTTFGGYEKGDPALYDRASALHPKLRSRLHPDHPIQILAGNRRLLRRKRR
jgi:hypothetical protein